ncbi:uncharacterized protein EV154DRAFT_482186 [Mucor mucedo]|uniref:uncharacterized protein n=1 Tax=Mucor mucedo TaxID=29922 RepID=UPI00221F98C2|nr:uncharacterized protein EV154DRAFT_482186 [Mucor mucedo]KAI7890459.1 hypothetical protein EV154DRAFT_482186 [Mucor mucedo]
MSDTLDRITESVKRCRIIEYPDQLGKRTIATNFEELEGKKVSDRRNNLQDPNRSDSFNEAFEDTGRDQYPIIADVLSPQVEVASKPSRYMSQNNKNREQIYWNRSVKRVKARKMEGVNDLSSKN